MKLTVSPFDICGNLLLESKESQDSQPSAHGGARRSWEESHWGNQSLVSCSPRCFSLMFLSCCDVHDDRTLAKCSHTLVSLPLPSLTPNTWSCVSCHWNAACAHTKIGAQNFRAVVSPPANSLPLRVYVRVCVCVCVCSSSRATTTYINNVHTCLALACSRVFCAHPPARPPMRFSLFFVLSFLSWVVTVSALRLLNSVEKRTAPHVRCFKRALLQTPPVSTWNVCVRNWRLCKSATSTFACYSVVGPVVFRIRRVLALSALELNHPKSTIVGTGSLNY